MAVKPSFQILIIVAIAIVAYVATIELTTSPENDMATQDAATGLAPVTFFDKNEGKVMLADFEGQVVLVNLWATWCPPCVVELPALDSLQARFKDKNFRVVAISMDHIPSKAIAAFLKARKIENLDLYRDKDRQIPAKWHYSGIPTSYLIARDGKIIEKFEGDQKWDKGPVFEKIAAAVK